MQLRNSIAELDRKVFNDFLGGIANLKHLMLMLSPVVAFALSDGESHDDAMLPVPETAPPQTKVPLNGRDHISSLKVLAMKQAKDRKKQLAKLGHTSNLDFSPLSLDKLEPEFVSEALSDFANHISFGCVFQGEVLPASLVLISRAFHKLSWAF